MALKTLSIEKLPPAAPYGDATRKRPLVFVFEKPNLETETVQIHETQLDEFLENVLGAFRRLTNNNTLSADSVVALIWTLWKRRKRGATLAQVLNVDIEQ